jgi:hypothetical protein
MANKTKTKRVQQVKQVKTKSLPARINKVRDLIESAGNTIGSVEFKKRSTGEQRKMAYRLHVVPDHVRENEGSGQQQVIRDRDAYIAGIRKRQQKREKDLKNLQLTVFDTNVREVGRSSYRIIPLENVTKVRVKGVTYEIL